jgi:NTP pyrophosphatase (non-canonical NTP hydrolase)
MNLAEMAEEVEQVNREHGWYDDERTFGDLVALLHSEVSEALEAYRKWGLDDATASGSAYVLDGFKTVQPKPEGVGSEFADTLIRLLDMSKRYGIDLEAEYRRKVEYNRTRGYRHGGKRL